MKVKDVQATRDNRGFFCLTYAMDKDSARERLRLLKREQQYIQRRLENLTENLTIIEKEIAALEGIIEEDRRPPGPRF